MSFTDDQPPRVKEQIIITLPRSARNRAVAKCLIILLGGLAFGYFYQQDLSLQLQKAEKMTKEQYIADFEVHKAKLRENAVPPLAAPFIGLIAVCMVYGSYELVVALVSWMMGKLLK